jgi:hypothetical protein
VRALMIDGMVKGAPTGLHFFPRGFPLGQPSPCVHPAVVLPVVRPSPNEVAAHGRPRGFDCLLHRLVFNAESKGVVHG